MSPQVAPFTIGLAYAAMVWGFADITISTNLARDLGTRFVAAIFFGREAFTYLNYSWIAILVNIPATIFATGYYEFLMRDSVAKIAGGHAVHEHGEEGLMRHVTRTVRTPFVRLKSRGITKKVANQLCRRRWKVEQPTCSTATARTITVWERESTDRNALDSCSKEKISWK